MTTKYVTLSFVIALAAGGLWFGRMSWRVRHQLVTLHVRNVPLAKVLKNVEKQTRSTIRAERGLDTRITLRLTDKPLAYVLDRLAEQAGARWSTVYAVYESPRSLGSLDAALRADGKLEPAGWMRLAPMMTDLKEPGGPDDALQPGPNPQIKSIPDDSTPGGRVVATEDAVFNGPAAKGPGGPSAAPRIMRLVRKGGPDGAGTEQEDWTPEELILEADLNGRLGKERPESATPEAAAQTAQNVRGRWTTLYVLRKSMFGIGFGGMPMREPLPGKGNSGGPLARPNAEGARLKPADLQQAATRERNEQFARLTPDQRVQRARARHGFDQN